jgi:diadenosine tetraphosphatase ApaH/serine/threonine PP2A family protein phosphatase
LKVFICSDIHGNVRALNAAMFAYRTLSQCEFLFLGDCVGYGAHPDACLDIILNLPRSRLILGNHDSALVHASERGDLNDIAAEAIDWSEVYLRGAYDDAIRRRFKLQHEDAHYFAVHSSPYHPEEWLYILSGLDAEQAFFAKEFRVCFVGHTHVPAAYAFGKGEVLLSEEQPLLLEAGDRYLINPGSVGQPRDGDPRAACCIFDTEAGTITLHRCAYDVEAEARDIINAGLPTYLAERLLVGA